MSKKIKPSQIYHFNLLPLTCWKLIILLAIWWTWAKLWSWGKVKNFQLPISVRFAINLKFAIIIDQVILVNLYLFFLTKKKIIRKKHCICVELFVKTIIFFNIVFFIQLYSQLSRLLIGNTDFEMAKNLKKYKLN